MEREKKPRKPFNKPNLYKYESALVLTAYLVHKRAYKFWDAVGPDTPVDIKVNELKNKFCSGELLAWQKEGYSDITKEDYDNGAIVRKHFESNINIINSQDTISDSNKSFVFIDTNTLFGPVYYTLEDLYKQGLGGAENAILNTMENLALRGHKVTAYNHQD